MTRSLLAEAEERWLIPTYASPRAGLWIAGHRCLTLPFRLRGALRRYESITAERRLTVVTAGTPRRLRGFGERLAGPLADAAGITEMSGATAAGGTAMTSGKSLAGGTRQAVWSPAQLAAFDDADLVVAEIHRWSAPWFRRAGWHIVPSVVRWWGDLAQLPPPVLSKSVRDDLRKVREHAYELKQGTTAADWDAFYHEMVVPQAERRFGDAAWIPSPRLMRRLRQSGVLQFVCRRGKRVGGFCVVPNGESIWLPLLGMRAGDGSLRRDGALAAVYVLGFTWGKAQGYRWVDIGRTSPFVQDGVARYKSKWGLTPIPDPLAHLFAMRLRPSAAVHELFAREPVRVETDGRLVTFAGETS